jgi:trehalose 6-phosphate phosphatase
MLPHASVLLPALRAARAAAGSLLLGLDFDGTLAPIVARPEDAALHVDVQSALSLLAQRSDTHIALISGRGLHDLRQRAPIPGAFYAGNHGLEIDGPHLQRIHHDAQRAVPRLAQLAARLEQALEQWPGAQVEDKGLTLSVHYRRVPDAETAARVRAAVNACTQGETGLRVTRGRKVVEIRPLVDWHKGRALLFVRESLEQRFGPAPAAFIGDDTTDEDAFRVLGQDDYPIRVGTEPPADTAASALLSDPQDVAVFLRALNR